MIVEQKKTLVLINGTPGIGKTTVSRELHKTLEHSAWLDGDWCWMINPFVVNQENVTMVESNIATLLNRYMENSSIRYIIFNWVIPNNQIMDKIITSITVKSINVIKITLMCLPSMLEKRLRLDGRSDSKIKDSIRRLSDYHSMDSIKLNTTDLSIQQTVDEILRIISMHA